jgi:hypothetical protein
MKKEKEKRAHKLYNDILKNKIEPLTGNTITYLDQLNKVGKKLFGSKFHGVYASNQIKKLTDAKPYCILNLDSSDQPGSHWIAIAKQKKNTYVHDSFGRTATEIIPNLRYSGNGKIINADTSDKEQKVTEFNCGAQACAFIYIFDKYGSDTAILI